MQSVKLPLNYFKCISGKILKKKFNAQESIYISICTLIRVHVNEIYSMVGIERSRTLCFQTTLINCSLKLGLKLIKFENSLCKHKMNSTFFSLDTYMMSFQTKRLGVQYERSLIVINYKNIQN